MTNERLTHMMREMMWPSLLLMVVFGIMSRLYLLVSKRSNVQYGSCCHRPLKFSLFAVCARGTPYKERNNILDRHAIILL